MNIKERINTIKAKRAQIEALLSAKEKEVKKEEERIQRNTTIKFAYTTEKKSN